MAQEEGVQTWRVFEKLAKAGRLVTSWRTTEILISEREPEPVDDLDWLISNIAELRHQYAGQWIAIAQGQVVAQPQPFLN